MLYYEALLMGTRGKGWRVSGDWLRYIWVDSLFIVQDDDETRHGCTESMASIYGGPFIIIITAQERDAHSSLQGLLGILNPRELPQDVCRLHDLLVIKTYQSKLHVMPWVERGWTFQEYLFSPRNFVFSGDSVHWDCSCV
jgi:hypothetical protein